MYRNVFRGGHANGLEVCKKADIIEKKQHNKTHQPAESNTDVEKMQRSTLAGNKKIRGATQTKTDVP